MTKNDSSVSGSVVILHGLLGSARNWRTIQNMLAQKSSFRIDAVDMRNHGKSRPHQQSMSIEDMADDVELFVREKEGEPVNLVGHSMGGKAAMHLCLTRPHLVDKLVVVDVAPVNYNTSVGEHEHLIRSMMKIKLNEIESVFDAHKLLMEDVKDKRIVEFLLTNLSPTEDKKYEWNVPLKTLLEHVPDVRAMPLYDKGEKFEKPVLFIAGEKGDYMKRSDEGKIKIMFPNAEFQYFDAGHWVHAEKPKEFVSSVLKFLQ